MLHAPHCRGWLLAIATVATMTLAVPARALDVSVVGVFPGKAVVVIGKGAPRTIAVGQKTAEGVTLLAVGDGVATLDIEGQKRTLALGQHYATAAPGAEQKAVIPAGMGGHFLAEGKVNGGTVRFLVDTGATSVALPADEARRLGINYLAGKRGLTSTANGVAPMYRVTLDTVTVGGITLNGVEAIVLEGGLTSPLLGMSFLSRTNMLREGETLTLVRRF
jgi:aspartyl protease family protein